MITPPAHLAPPPMPRWEWVAGRALTWGLLVRVRRRPWADVESQFTSGAYWVRYWDWSVTVVMGPYLFVLRHYVVRVF